MEFTSSNSNDKLEKIEPQVEPQIDAQASDNSQFEKEASHASNTAQENLGANEKANHSQANNHYRSHNPILDFVKNLGETAEYLWDHYLNWVIHVSWGKMFLACLLILIAGSCLFLHTLANWFVFGSLLLKCFVGKEDQATKKSSSEYVKPEEN